MVRSKRADACETSSAEADANAESEMTGMLRRGCGWCSLIGGQERSAGERHEIGGYEEGYSGAWGGDDATVDASEDGYVA